MYIFEHTDRFFRHERFSHSVLVLSRDAELVWGALVEVPHSERGAHWLTDLCKCLDKNVVLFVCTVNLIFCSTFTEHENPIL